MGTYSLEKGNTKAIPKKNIVSLACPFICRGKPIIKIFWSYKYRCGKIGSFNFHFPYLLNHPQHPKGKGNVRELRKRFIFARQLKC